MRVGASPAAVGRSLACALLYLFHPRMLWLMVWPAMLALALWSAVAIFAWTRAALALAGVLRQWLESAAWLARFDLGDAVLVAAHLMLAFAFVPLVVLTALLILGACGMPAMVEHVAARSFPGLARRRGGSFAGGLWNSAVALAGALALGLASLPLWLLPPFWPLIPLAILAWVNQRVLRYDALAEHAAVGEMRAIFAARRGKLALMGFLLALFAYVPVVGLAAPTLFGLAFIHYLLAELEALRAAPIEGSATTVE